MSHVYRQEKGLPLDTPLRARRKTVRNEAGEKQCPRCNRWLDERAFAEARGRYDGRNYYCQNCQADIHLLRTYGLTRDDYNALWAKQGKQCAVCDATEPRGGGRWVVDHDHTTGRVRGILCNLCNSMLGNGADDVELLRRGVEYLAQQTV